MDSHNIEDSILSYKKRLEGIKYKENVVTQMKEALLTKQKYKSYYIYWPTIEDENNTMTCIYDSIFEETNIDTCFHIVNRSILKKGIYDNTFYKECNCNNHKKNIPLNWNEFISYKGIKNIFESFKKKRRHSSSCIRNNNHHNHHHQQGSKKKKIEVIKQFISLNPFPLKHPLNFNQV